jgi:hypothetical protein
MSNSILSDQFPPRRPDDVVSAGAPTAWTSALHVMAYTAAFALVGAVIALAGFMLSDGPAWFAVIPAGAVAGWYVGTHPSLIATCWACRIGAGPVFW